MATQFQPAPRIVGRDEFIAEVWRILELKSLYMNDLRRIGKTQIIRKMHAELPPDWLAAFSDLEGTHTAEEFAALVYKDSAVALPEKKRKFRRMIELLGKAAGTEIMGILKLPDGQPALWKDVLRRTFDDIDDSLREPGPGRRMVFFWDEVPFMLDNIASRQGKETAMEVLDILRELSQRHEHIRLLLTGSIGIHHVLRSLWGDGYKGSPLNHMNHVQPGPLAPEHAVPFAEAEITRRGLRCEPPGSCAAVLSEAVGHIPFYIEKLVACLPRGENLTPASINAALERELRSDTNDWDLDYYRRRVKTAFGERERLVLSILDTLAAAEASALSFQKIGMLVRSRMETDDEALRDLLKLLCMDHYLVRNEANEYRFYLPLIRRRWKINRSL